MGFLEFIRAVAALAVTLGLVGLAAVVLRRYAPELIARLQTGTGKAERRLQVLESLVLDPSRRLVLVNRRKFSMCHGSDSVMLVSRAHGIGKITKERCEAP